ncbi:MAG: DUF2283 domain-containing protein [candidate division KSB1 bacterium]|nr:DUF2283 domain-containing protein [candidate division KSB1 bacterium]
MRLKIDQKNDALYFRLDESAIVDSEEVKPGIILDYDANDNVVGIEILGLSKRVPVETFKSLLFETV